MSSSPPSTIPRHATHRYHTAMLAIGGALMLIGGFGAFGALEAEFALSYVAPAVLLGVGATLAVLGFVGRSAGAGVQLVNTSFDLIARGHFAEAEKLLEQADKTNRSPLVQCVSALQRALIAMRRGDAQTGLVHVDRALAVKPGLWYRQAVQLQKVNGLGIRAFLRSVAGDREGTRKDAQELRASPLVLPQALARGALAEAICLEKEGDRDVLRAHLAEHHDLLFDVTDRRERAIVRAFQRMLESTATSVYRKPAKLDMHGDEPPLVDWVAQLVPSAAPFVETKKPTNVSNDLPAAVASDEAKKALTNSRKEAAKQVKPPATKRGRLLLAWALCLAAFAGLWTFVFPEPGSVPAGDHGDSHWDWPDLIPLIGAMYGLVLAAAVGRRLWQARKARKEAEVLFGAMNLSAQGKLDAAKETLSQLAASRFAIIQAQAHLALAYIAERRADLKTALEHCDKGIACLSRYVLRISASDILLPDLMSQRAFVLAAMGRHDEADAELAELAPVYPYRSRALLRVRLVSLARRGDLEAAAKLATETNLDLPLTARDEMLANVACAVAKPETLSAGELPRIRRELQMVASLRPWLSAVAPKALTELERLSEEAPTGRDETSVDHAAELEARAEAEAARDEAALRLDARTI